MSTSEIQAKLSRIEGMTDGRLNEIERNQAKLAGFVDELQAKDGRPTQTATQKDAEQKAFASFIRTGDDHELKEMSIVAGAADGEALVPEFIADEIIERALALSPLASVVRNTAVSTSDYVRLLNLRGQAASWISETGSRVETESLQLREIRPTHGELYSVVAVTNWLLNDSKFDVVDLIRSNAAAQFSKSLEASIISGSGTNRPTGILNSASVSTGDDDSPERGADTVQNVSGTADLANDIISLYFSLKPEYRQNATFVMSSATLAAVRKLRDTSGSGYLWQSGLGSGVDANDGTLLGKPVITSESLGASGTSPLNDSILCGDFDLGYELTRIGGLQIIDDRVTTRGKTLFYVAQRFGGRLVDNNAIKALRA